MTAIEHPEPGSVQQLGGWFYAGPTLSRWQRLCLWLAGIEPEMCHWPTKAAFSAATLAFMAESREVGRQLREASKPKGENPQ